MKRRDRPIAGPLAFVTAFVVISLLTLHPEWLGFPVNVSRVVWLPSGLAVGVVLRYGARYIGWTFVAEFIVTILSGDPFFFAVGASVGNAMEAAIALLVLRRAAFRPTLERGRDVVALILGGAVLAAFAGSIISVTSLVAFDPPDSASAWRILVFWWLTHANGILLGVPILLGWWYGSFERIREHAFEAFALALAVVALGFLLFEPVGGTESARRFLYVPLPVLIWSAFRFRLAGAAAANLLLALPVMAFTALERGPFNEVAGSGVGPDSLFQLWVFIAVNAVTSLFVAAVVEEREREVAARIAAEEERTRMSERVARARRAESLGVLAGGIAHDFNNLLVSIMGHAELAGLRLEGHPAGDSVDEIMRASQRAAEICRQMLAYAGRGRVSNSTVDLSEVAAEMTELLSVSFDEATRVEVYLEGRVRPIWGDITQLRRVTLNLLTNAADALPDGRGRIRVSTGPIARHQLSAADLVAGSVPEEGDLVHLTVEDDGAGLDPDLRDRIFEPFFSTKSNGRGLGLAAVLGIVVAHDGLLELRSRAAEGARFRLVFPVTDREPAVEPDDPDMSLTVDGASVLIADDEDGVREVVVGMLEEAGATVESVSDGLEAVRVFGDGPGRFDVVILDITMPRLGGVEALARIREIRPHMPVVLMTGNVGDADRVSKVHDVPVLMKPFRLHDVTAIVERVRAAPV